jgi:transposase
MPLRILVTSGAVADCTQADGLIKGMRAQCLLADRGYDSNAIVSQARKQGMQVVIPSKRNRKIKRDCDMAIYKHRHLVENAFYHLKRWRGVATRYAKNASSFLVAAQIRCLDLWTKIL